MLQSISNNPFRILGVFSNTPLKDIVSNKRRMSAFLRVNKPIEFPCDLVPLIGPIDRTEQAIAQADSELTIKDDRLRAALFWFINGDTQFDAIAFGHVQANNLDQAIEIWSRQENLSSLQNLVVAHLVKGNVRPAAIAASKLYERYATEFMEKVEVTGLSQLDITGVFIDTLINEQPGLNVDLIVGEGFPLSWNTAARAKVVAPIVASLNAAVDKSKKVRQGNKNADEIYQAGVTLNAEAMPLLIKMRGFVNSNDIELVNIADKVANEVLQCSIDAYNVTDNLAYAHTALILLEKAKVIALGSVTKDRIRENEEILRSNAASAPPVEVDTETAALDEMFRRYSTMPQTVDNAWWLYNGALPILTAIAQKLPASRRDFMLARNSQMANLVLNYLIEEVNNSQKLLHANMDADVFKQIRDTINSACKLTYNLTRLNLDQQAEKRVNQNYKTIYEIAEDLNKVKVKSGSNPIGCIIWIIVIIVANIISVAL